MALIEREAFRNELLSLTYYGGGEYYSGREAERDAIIDRLNEQPVIDVAPVVRDEKWRPIAGYEGLYMVSNQGRVMNTKGLLMKQRDKHSHFTTYKKVSLWKDGAYRSFYVHRLVAAAFVPNPSGGNVVNHIDENGSNNAASNLVWCSKAYNRVFGNAVENHAQQIRGVRHTEEHKRKISDGLRRYYSNHDVWNKGSGARMDGGEGHEAD